MQNLAYKFSTWFEALSASDMAKEAFALDYQSDEKKL